MLKMNVLASRCIEKIILPEILKTLKVFFVFLKLGGIHSKRIHVLEIKCFMVEVFLCTFNNTCTVRIGRLRKAKPLTLIFALTLINE